MPENTNAARPEGAPTSTQNYFIQHNIHCDICNEPANDTDHIPSRTHNEHFVCKICDNETFYYCENSECGQFFRADNSINEDWGIFCSNDCARECEPEPDRDNDSAELGRRNATHTIYGDYAQPSGDIMKSPRVFGVELETIYRDNEKADEAARALKIPLWGIHEDASIDRDDSEGTAEWVSPPLFGKMGENEIKKACSVLRSHSFAVNDSCGFHLHLSAPEYRANPHEDIKTPTLDHLPRVSRNRTPHSPRNENEMTRRNYGKAAQNLKTLFVAYIALERLFLSLVCKKRRRNRYCMPLSASYPLKKILLLDDYYALERLWYEESEPANVERRKSNGKMDDTRYKNANFHSLFRYGAAGTFEIRSHSGTLNAIKILHWTNLHASILDAIASGKLTIEALLPLTDGLKTPVQLVDFIKPYIGEATATYCAARITRLSKEN